MIIKSVFKPHKETQVKSREVVGVYEETKSDEYSAIKVMEILVRSMTEGVKKKQREKEVSHKASMKNTDMVKKQIP